MSPLLKGQCPTAHAPMQTGDGLLGRVKPPLGQVSSDDARAIAAAATHFGSGKLELTNRGAIQVRGLSPAGVAGFCEAIVGAGLASADPVVEQRRNVALTPFSDIHTAELAFALEQWVQQGAGLAALPPKFGFAVDSAQSPAPALSADIRCVRRGGDWRITLDGASLAVMTAAPLDPVIRLTESFLALSHDRVSRPRRIRDLVARIGAEAIYRNANLTPTDAERRPRVAPCATVGWTGDTWCGFGLGCPFGALDASALIAAADLADRYSGGWMRVTAYRALLLRDVAPSDAKALATAARNIGFIVTADDPRLAITACVGRPACSSAFTPARDDALKLIALHPSWLGAGVHLSGCSKGCARPEATAVTLVGGPDGYDIVINGRTIDAPIERQLSLAQAIQALNERNPAQP